MPNIRLIREVTNPGDRGPSRGQYALQKALREADIPWLKVGGALQHGEVPWIWSWQDTELAVQFAEWRRPFIIGPNVLFANSQRPGAGRHEITLLDAETCILQFTESDWYASLIQSHLDRNEAPIVIWHYPIYPEPGGPLEPDTDLLIYLKDLTLGREVARAQQKFPKSKVVAYGHYNREAMIEVARRSRACLYLSSDDRGPLAAAEIALSGCPLIGIERGCPWVQIPQLGIEVPAFDTNRTHAAIEQALQMDRDEVHRSALCNFSAANAVGIIREALEPIATR